MATKLLVMSRAPMRFQYNKNSYTVIILYMERSRNTKKGLVDFIL